MLIILIGSGFYRFYWHLDNTFNKWIARPFELQSLYFKKDGLMWNVCNSSVEIDKHVAKPSGAN